MNTGTNRNCNNNRKRKDNTKWSHDSDANCRGNRWANVKVECLISSRTATDEVGIEEKWSSFDGQSRQDFANFEWPSSRCWYFFHSRHQPDYLPFQLNMKRKDSVQYLESAAPNKRLNLPSRCILKTFFQLLFTTSSTQTSCNIAVAQFKSIHKPA